MIGGCLSGGGLKVAYTTNHNTKGEALREMVGWIHEDAINHRFQIVLWVSLSRCSSLPCMQFDVEQKEDKKEVGYSYTAVCACDARAAAHTRFHIATRTLLRQPHLLDSLSLSLSLRASTNWNFIGKRAKPKACSTIHRAHGRHGQQCQSQDGFQLPRRVMKIAWECMPSIHFKRRID